MAGNSKPNSKVPVQNITYRTVDSLATSDRPMQQAVQIPVETKKHNKGLIALIILGLLLLVCGGIIAALLSRNLGKKDSVAAAVAKIVSGQASENALVDGDIEISSDSQTAIVSNIKITLRSGIKLESLINASKATITATIRDIGDLTVQVDEVYATGNDLFLKISGAAEAIEDSGILHLLDLTGKLPMVVDCGEDKSCQSKELTEIQCTEGEECEEINATTSNEQTLPEGEQIVLDEDTMTFIASMIDAIELIDGEWLRISVDELGDFINKIPQQNYVGCIANLVDSLNTNSNSVAELYSRYPFIVSSDEDISAVSKQFPVRKVFVDTANFMNFANSIQSTTLSEQIYSCLNTETSVQVTEQDITNIIQYLPIIYAEVDDDNNFTRLYIESTIRDADECDCSEELACDCAVPTNIRVAMDLNISYPQTINAPEPLEYQDLSDIIQDLSTSIYESEEEVTNESDSENASDIDK